MVLAATLIFVAGGPAAAQQAKCLAGKSKCVSKKATGLLKCHTNAETPGKPADPNAGGCVTKVEDKFDGGVDPTKGCFEKLENKSGNDCVTVDDTVAAEGAVDSCVTGLVEAIDPAPITQTKCGAGKKKCVSKYLKSVLKCHQLAQTPGKSTDANANGCLTKASDKYTGGVDPTKGCFAKLENKSGNDCGAPTGNSATLQGLVDDCVDDLDALLTPTTTSSAPTTTTSTTAGPTTTGGPTTTTSTSLPLPMVVGVLTPPTKGLFNYNSTIGLPAVNAACPTQFPGSHPCTQADLAGAPAGDLMGLKDNSMTTVTSLWAIDGSAPPLQQCNDDAMGGSGLNWEYGTAHTVSRGRRFALNNGTGVLTGPTLEQCALLGTTSWVACCQ
jgi:hypothetical protein